MNYFIQTVNRINEFIELVSALSEGTPACVTGLSSIHKSLFISALLEQKKNILVITPDEASAVRMCEDVNTFSGEQNAVLFPVKDLQLISDITASEDYNQRRLDALAKIMSGKRKVLVASVEAAMQMTVSKQVFEDKKIIIKSGILNRDDFASKLLESGYTPVSQIEGKGQFSVRGDIIDVFPIGEDEPVRIELWGDDIDSVSYFDIETQRRTKSVKKVIIYPAKEVIFDSTEAETNAIKNEISKIKGKNAELIQENLLKDIEKIENGVFSSNSDKYIHLAYNKPTTVFDFFEGQMGVLCEYSSVKDKANSAENCKIYAKFRGTQSKVFSNDSLLF